MVKEAPNATELSPVDGLVRFQGVSFSYDSLSSTLSNIDLEAKPGEVTALLGATGSGKSIVYRVFGCCHFRKTSVLQIMLSRLIIHRSLPINKRLRFLRNPLSSSKWVGFSSTKLTFVKWCTLDKDSNLPHSINIACAV